MKRQAITFIFLLLASFSFAQTDGEIKTTIEFEETTFDFGTITSGEKVNYVYKFTNTGDNPLLITMAKGSCGCTVPSWPKEPIMPGESGDIEVQFNSKGKSGRQSKRITITANTDPAQTYLTITGDLEKAELPMISPDAKTLLATPPITTPKKKWDKPKVKDCFAIFPNPTTEVLKLELKEYMGKSAYVNILNASGKNLASRKINEITKEIIEFNVLHYTPGTYYVNIQIDKDLVSTKCFVVANK